MIRFSLPREMTWYSAPGNSMRNGPAMLRFYHTGLNPATLIPNPGLTPEESRGIHRAGHFTFDNVTIDWRDVPDGPWDRVADVQESRHIPLDTLRHVRGK